MIVLKSLLNIQKSVVKTLNFQNSKHIHRNYE